MNAVGRYKGTSIPPFGTNSLEKEVYRRYNAVSAILATASQLANQTTVNVLNSLCKEHPLIAINPHMLGGVPHIKGHRLSVGDILSKLYIYGEIDKVLDIYTELSKDQAKEAIAFAQDFLEEMSGTS